MRFNDQFINFPPFISTSWRHVAALHYADDQLVIHLIQGISISIPNLRQDVVDLIFKAHATYLEKENLLNSMQSLAPENSLMGVDKLENLAQRLGINSVEGLNSTAQHNPALANAPDLPKELIQKIATITKAVVGDDARSFPKSEPHCNCFYCQIARGLHDSEENNLAVESINAIDEEIVPAEELRFQQWDIKSSGDQLYTVTNRLDTLEQYNVYLGKPIGCTCGKTGCEHVVAVLNT